MVELLFNVFDDDKNGSINFQEFVCALSVMTRGTPDEKLECMWGIRENRGEAGGERTRRREQKRDTYMREEME